MPRHANANPSRSRILAACLASACVASALGHGMIPRDAPVERLIENISEQLKKHPDDPEWYYRLGRVHMLALERKSNFIPSWSHDLSRVVEGSWASERRLRDGDPNPPATREDLERHLSEAITNLNKAITLRPLEPRFRLTLACTLEAGATYRTASTPWPLPPELDKPTAETLERELSNARSLVRASVKSDEAKGRLLDQLRQGNTEHARNRDIIVSAARDAVADPACAGVVDEVQRTDWLSLTEELFFGAMCYALPTDGKATEKPIWGGMDDWVAYEAANDFVRIIEARTPRDSDQIRLKVAKATIKAFDELPHPNAITPIVFSLMDAPLSKLTSATASSFDLEGTGRPQQWQWLTPDTGLLVWDPSHTGMISSGTQLFGSVSWWLFFDNGYQALACLDDNHNGELVGPELKGIAAWFDRNSNGVSDKGEVVPLAELNIEAISTNVTGTADDGRSPMSSQGLRMLDGRTLPTYDWIAETTPSTDARMRPMEELERGGRGETRR